jgi:hypothetical protein
MKGKKPSKLVIAATVDLAISLYWLTGRRVGPAPIGPIPIGGRLIGEGNIGCCDAAVATTVGATALTVGCAMYTVFFAPFFPRWNVTDASEISAIAHPSMERPLVSGKDALLPTETSTVTTPRASL